MLTSFLLFTATQVNWPTFTGEFISYEGGISVVLNYVTDEKEIVGYSFFRMTNSFVYFPLWIQNGKARVFSDGHEQGLVLLGKIADNLFIASDQPADPDSSEGRRYTIKYKNGEWISGESTRLKPLKCAEPLPVLEVPHSALDKEKLRTHFLRIKKKASDESEFKTKTIKIAPDFELRSVKSAPDSIVPWWLMQSDFEVSYLAHQNQSKSLASVTSGIQNISFSNLLWVSPKGWMIFRGTRGDKMGLVWIKKKDSASR